MDHHTFAAIGIEGNLRIRNIRRNDHTAIGERFFVTNSKQPKRGTGSVVKGEFCDLFISALGVELL